jgi:hypothetical protein
MLVLGIPFGPEFVTVETKHLTSAAAAAALGLVLNEAAYMAEIVRCGITPPRTFTRGPMKFSDARHACCGTLRCHRFWLWGSIIWNGTSPRDTAVHGNDDETPSSRSRRGS